MIPPQHSVTSSITVLSIRAFDTARIEAEQDAMPDGGTAHPWSIYYRGESRYDLDAPYPVGDQVRCARDYIKPNHGCREWKPRRLKATEVALCRDAGRPGGRVVQLTAFALAMSSGKPLTDAQVDDLAQEYGVAELCEVGEAAIRASEAPKAAEKKL